MTPPAPQVIRSLPAVQASTALPGSSSPSLDRLRAASSATRIPLATVSSSSTPPLLPPLSVSAQLSLQRILALLLSSFHLSSLISPCPAKYVGHVQAVAGGNISGICEFCGFSVP